jgi:hypothetical protein
VSLLRVGLILFLVVVLRNANSRVKMWPDTTLVHPVKMTYADMVVRSEQKEDLTLGASSQGGPNAFGQQSGAQGTLWNRPDVRAAKVISASGRWQEHTGEWGPDASAARLVILCCVRSSLEHARGSELTIGIVGTTLNTLTRGCIRWTGR